MIRFITVHYGVKHDYNQDLKAVTYAHSGSSLKQK